MGCHDGMALAQMQSLVAAVAAVTCMDAERMHTQDFKHEPNTKQPQAHLVFVAADLRFRNTYIELGFRMRRLDAS